MTLIMTDKHSPTSIAKIATTGFLLATLLTACNRSTDHKSEQIAPQSEIQDSKKHDSPNQQVAEQTSEKITDSTVQPNHVEQLMIDAQKINEGRQPININEFSYPFEIDSQPVKNYASMYQLDAKTARHNLTIGMVSNEALSKILDKIGQNYISHQLTEGSKDQPMQLIITTTDKVTPTQFDYVIADDFAKGLVLPVQIQNSGQNK